MKKMFNKKGVFQKRKDLKKMNDKENFINFNVKRIQNEGNNISPNLNGK